MRELARRAAHEVSFLELSEEQMERLYVLDEYPSEAIHFDVQGYDVAINNEKLADALTALPDDKRGIVLLAYFLDMRSGDCRQAEHGTPHSPVQTDKLSQRNETKIGGS